ncbi:MAG: hypothetical protein LBI34_01940 [Puniceicoccales bacterium]|jgi:hypothetical protein|nr:hypothetical protein [Puniceicoccales bacterium]
MSHGVRLPDLAGRAGPLLLKKFSNYYCMVRRNLIILSLLGAVIVMGIFVQKMHKLFLPDANVPQSEGVVQSADHVADNDPPLEWQPPERGWNLFTPPEPIASTQYPVTAKKDRETSPHLSMEGYIATDDALAYIIVGNTTSGRSHRMARGELIPNTNFTVVDFYRTGSDITAKLSDGEIQYSITSREQ